MVHKPISIMILPVFVAAVLIMAILANQAYASSKSESSSSEKCKTTENGNSQGEENCKTAQGGKVAQEVKESSNTGNTEESNNHPMCLNEHTEIWEPCVVKNSSQKQESSNTPSSQESSKTGKEVKESSNTGKEVKESSNNGQSSVPVRAPITITPMRAHITNTKTHMTTTN